MDKFWNFYYLGQFTFSFCIPVYILGKIIIWPGTRLQEVNELQMLLMAGITIGLFKRKSSTNEEFVSYLLMTGRMISTAFLYFQSYSYAALYFLLSIVLIVLFPPPTYQGAHYVQTLDLESFLKCSKDKQQTWVVLFYVTWSPACKYFDEVFSNLSLKYSKFMNFGKLNVNDSMNSEIASTFGVDITGVNLPAIIIFSKGQEFSRVPTLLPNGKSVKWKMNEETAIKELKLDQLKIEIEKSSKNKRKEL